MANGWAEFFDQPLEQDQVDFDAIWSDFVRRSQASPHAHLLERLIRNVQILPAPQRVVLAFSIAALLTPVEWPPEWEAERRRLVEGMESLLRAINPRQPDSFSALLDMGADESAHTTGYSVLQSALNLLRTPCRRDEIPFVVRLCNIGHTTCLGVYRRALARREGQPMQGALLDARTRYVVAFEHYALAARALNSAVGAVLFEGLDARLESPEA